MSFFFCKEIDECQLQCSRIHRFRRLAISLDNGTSHGRWDTQSQLAQWFFTQVNPHHKVNIHAWRDATLAPSYDQGQPLSTRHRLMKRTAQRDDDDNRSDRKSQPIRQSLLWFS